MLTNPENPQLTALRIFIVDDRPSDRSTYRRWIQRSATIPLDIQEIETGAQALEACRTSPPHCLLLDSQLPDMTGLEFLEQANILQAQATTPIIFLTRQGNRQVAAQAIKLGAQDYLIKSTLSEKYLWHHIQHAINQITTLRRLHALEQQSRIILQSSGDGLVVVGTNGLILFTNPAAEQLFRQSTTALLGAPFGFPVVQGEVREITIRHQDTSFTVVEMRVVPIEWENEAAYLITLRDLTERRKTEEERQRHETERQYAQKLESLGVLAGGIAHDFNNLLMTIVARAGLALRSLLPEDPAREHMHFIEKAGLRGGELANQMLTFAGQTKLEFQQIQFSTLLKEMKSFIRSSISKQISLTIESDDLIPPIRGDRGQLRQMIMNMAINAAEAIGECEGTIQFRLRAIDSSREDFRPFHLIGDLPWGPCVSITITDTGCGMRADLIPKIFDPFFTTKLPGRGLGLAAILGIIRAHGAALAIRSQEGHGSEFWLLFPISHRTPTPRPASVIIPNTQMTPSQAPLKVLVVDDEEDVRVACSLILQEFGMEPLVAGDGMSGITLFKQYQEQIGLVLLDLTMPQMDGARLCQEFRQLNPTIPILVFSGYAEVESMKHFDQENIQGFIQKPFQVEDLITKIQQLLGAAPLPS